MTINVAVYLRGYYNCQYHWKDPLALLRSQYSQSGQLSPLSHMVCVIFVNSIGLIGLFEILSCQNGEFSDRICDKMTPCKYYVTFRMICQKVINFLILVHEHVLSIRRRTRCIFTHSHSVGTSVNI